MISLENKSVAAAVLFALLVTLTGCAVYDDDYGWYRNERYERYSRYDLDRDGRIERWERYPDRYYDRYYDRDDWRYARGRWERRNDRDRYDD